MGYLSFELAHAFPGTMLPIDAFCLAFCLAGIFAGYGVLRLRRWWRLVCGIVATLLLLYGLGCLLTAGFEFGVGAFLWFLAAALFSAYSLFVISRYKDQIPMRIERSH